MKRILILLYETVKTSNDRVLGFSQCKYRRQGESDGQTRSVKSLTDADLITIAPLYSLFITLVFVCLSVCEFVAVPKPKPNVWDWGHINCGRFPISISGAQCWSIQGLIKT